MYKVYEKHRLPRPPENVDEFIQEVFMTLNFLRCTPKFFVNNFMEVMRNRHEARLGSSDHFTLQDVDLCIEQISNCVPGRKETFHLVIFNYFTHTNLICRRFW